jgi:hypothetical protein
MSVSTEISRLQGVKGTIRTKLVQMGLATNTDGFDTLATAVDSILDQGTVSATVKEGEVYTIPAGYHNGGGTVTGVSGGGNYELQTKTVIPSKKQQSVTPDSGKYGLSTVTVSAIPDIYQDVSSVTATATDVLAGKIFVASDGTVTAGTMVNNGKLTKTIDGLTSTSYTIPAGYTSGGTVSLTSDIENALAAL